MNGTAFVYGTLMAEEVLKLLIKRVPAHKPAVLPGYARHRVKGQVFPAIIPATPQDKVHGMVGIAACCAMDTLRLAGVETASAGSPSEQQQYAHHVTALWFTQCSEFPAFLRS
jgi:hypothetical protein